MKHANAAYELTFENQLNIHKDLIEEIEKAIDDAIAEAKTYTFINKEIPLPVAIMLDSYGYTFRKSGRFYNIFWDLRTL